MLQITNPDQTQTSIEFQDLLAQSDYTILYFYPKDDTPGCTLEAQDFKVLAKEFEKL
jgi:peroxiredoxin Q/BCP